MGNLYLDRKGIQLEERAGALLVRIPDQPVRSVPLTLVETVVLAAGVVCDTAVLNRCVRLGVEVVMLSRTGPPCIVSAIGGGRHVRLRISQLRAATDPSFRSRYARRLVETKLHHQASFMRDAAERRPDLGYEMRRAADRLNNAARQVGRLEADGPGALMGTEGAAAAQFFLAYRLLFAKSLGFTGRNRRPPRDPVNATLSLGYTLLHVEAIKAVSGCGLDSGIGFLHEPEQGRESLACDLVETERALVDGLVWNLFRERQLRPEHFRITDGGCLMAKAARRAFYEAVEPVLTKARGRLRRRCAFLVRLLGSRAE